MGRIDRVNALMKKEISNIIREELQDPRIQFVTITHVEVSADLRYARVNFSVLNGIEEAEKTLKGLNRARGLVRKLVGQRIKMRYTPEIEFIHDKSAEYGAFIEEKLKEIQNESEQHSQNHKKK